MTLWSGMPRRMDSRRPTTGQNGRIAQIAVVPERRRRLKSTRRLFAQASGECSGRVQHDAHYNG